MNPAIHRVVLKATRRRTSFYHLGRIHRRFVFSTPTGTHLGQACSTILQRPFGHFQVQPSKIFSENENKAPLGFMAAADIAAAQPKASGMHQGYCGESLKPVPCISYRADLSEVVKKFPAINTVSPVNNSMGLVITRFGRDSCTQF